MDRTLVLVLALLVCAPAAGALPLAPDDAGSGRDAGEGDAAVPITLGQDLAGWMLVGVDPVDEYVVFVEAEQVVSAWVSATSLGPWLTLVSPEGAAFGPGRDEEVRSDVAGLWRIRMTTPDPRVAAAGDYTFRVDAEPASPQDDAGSGRDAGMVPGRGIHVGVGFYHAQMGGADDVDWFVVAAQPGDLVRLTTGVSGFDVFVDGESYGFIDALRTEEFYAGSTTTLRATDGAGAYVFSIDLATPPSSPDEGGSGADAAGDASTTALLPGGASSGWLGQGDDEADWYRVPVDAGERLRVEVLDGLQDGAAFEVLDHDGVRITAYLGAVEEGHAIAWTADHSGHYFVTISTDGVGGDYALHLDRQSALAQDDAGSGGDAPNRPTGAVALPDGASTGFAGDRDFMDTYRVELRPFEGVTIDLDVPEGADFDLHLTDADDNIFATSAGSGDESVHYWVARSDTYYLRVVAWEGAGDYTLHVQRDFPLYGI